MRMTHTVYDAPFSEVIEMTMEERFLQESGGKEGSQSISSPEAIDGYEPL